MKNGFIAFFMAALVMAGWGQVTGKVYIDEHAMDVPAGKSDHFEFEASKASLDDASTEYLQYFVTTYSNDFPKTPVIISIVPTSSQAKGENEKVAMKRIETIEKLLKKTKIQISKANYKDQVITMKMKLR